MTRARWVRTVAREVWGLFVDDGWFAAGIVVCVALGVGVARIGAGAWWCGVALFAGLAGVLVGSLVRFSGRNLP
jgi:hypothetical protein